MKIYILGPRNKVLDKTYDTIIDRLKKNGHKVDIGWRELSRDDDVKNYKATFRRNLNSIKNSDFVIAESSNPGDGIGFLIATALEYKKPVLALYNLEYAQDISTTLKAMGNKSALLTYEEYKNSTLEDILKGYLRNVKAKLDTKFILIISSQIDRYLTWASSTKRMHKAQIVRNSLEETMSKDKEWKLHKKE